MKQYYKTTYVIEFDALPGDYGYDDAYSFKTKDYDTYAEALERFEQLSERNPTMYEVVQSRRRVAGRELDMTDIFKKGDN